MLSVIHGRAKYVRNRCFNFLDALPTLDVCIWRCYTHMARIYWEPEQLGIEAKLNR